jgi:hypothetical protein
MSGLQYFMPRQPGTEDLLGVIAGGSSLSGASAQPSVNMDAMASSTPVKLMQKFVNNRGWGDVDVTGMRDWQGNVLSNPSMVTANANVNADAEKWAALSTLMNRLYGRNKLYYNTNSHNGGGPGGRGE